MGSTSKVILIFSSFSDDSLWRCKQHKRLIVNIPQKLFSENFLIFPKKAFTAKWNSHKITGYYQPKNYAQRCIFYIDNTKCATTLFDTPNCVINQPILGMTGHSYNQTNQNVNDTHMEELVLYWKNSLKYKVGCFWRFYMFTQSIEFF